MRYDKQKYITLLKEMTLADFKTKHINAYLGVLWNLLDPLLLFGAMYLVFSVFLDWRTPDYTVYLLLGIILWTFFSDVTAKGMVSIHGKAGLITKVNFPKEIIVFSSGINALITLIISFLVFIVMFIFSPVSFHGTIFLLPVFIAQLILVALGTSFFLSAFFLRFRDLSFIWSFLLKIGFWVTPVVIPLTKIPEKYHKFLLLNPLTNIIKGARDAVIYNTSPSIFNMVWVTLAALAIFLAGYFIFKRMEKYFADYVVF